MANFKMEFTTPLSKEGCISIIEHENAKDKAEAEIVIKILEGRTKELSYMRRKVAGQILHNMQKLALKEDQREWILANLRERVSNGSEHFISYEDGKLVIEFDEFGKLGSDFLKRTKKAEKNLMKRFSATSFRYIEEQKTEGEDNNVVQSENAA